MTAGIKSKHGHVPVLVEVPIYNGRDAAKTLDQNGFERVEGVVPEPFPGSVDFASDVSIVENYYPLVAEFMKTRTGAYKVFTFDHVRRSSSVSSAYKVDAAGQKIGGPAIGVHGDYALEGAPKRRDGFGLPPKNDDSFKRVYGDTPLIPPAELEALKGRRFAIVNLWRNLSEAPVVDMPLCFCDTMTSEACDYGTAAFRYIDRTLETYVGHYSPAQRWFYFPLLRRDEGVLLKTYDSQGALARDYETPEGAALFLPDQPSVPSTFTLHCAVRDPRLTDDSYPKRDSIEVRCIVFY